MTTDEAIAEIRKVIRLPLPDPAKVGMIAAILDDVDEAR